MPLPPFDAQGELPEGIYQATMDEVITRFGTGTAQRELLVSYLLRIYALIRATGKLERFIIFGSYVTAKADPNDVDVFLVMAEAFNVDEMSGDTRVIFSHTQAQSRLRASVFWATRSTSMMNIDALLVGWQTKRDQTRRGIVEVII
jgi:hypothetical protein